ncbi:adenosylcobinamide-phosphate synthase CbiB [Reinekea marinisedimentorum]|uniref:Cobalamin biosynthesis protein CobD n=1 Tax=Reinekea marinisedimentorum TaxID=230495 RepID=A0A4R3I2Y7_9GAMM|nr:adenosylcobinamide-phosphate synthase CbiB [Reinekea marinisedimentorum]TCS39035.1 adenosylcobinamide-phosphate synthase [Reinekea marinisedimentorum]
MWPSFLPEAMNSISAWLLMNAALMLIALGLDHLLGEPRRFHPLVGFGHLVMWLEPRCRRIELLPLSVRGQLAWLLAVLPIVLFTASLLVLLSFNSWLWGIASSFSLYLTLGGNSLLAHAEAIRQPLQAGDINRARNAVAMIVSRNSEQMDEQAITSAAVESVLENGNDAVFAPLFWFALFGAPGAVLLRLANTLDAMWGYRNERYLVFGRFAAKADDALGFIPARICALTYAAQGNTRKALHSWRTQAKQCASPNGGVVMTAGAGALQVTVGGAAVYFGVRKEKPFMGAGPFADWRAITGANRLVQRGSWGLCLHWFVFCLLNYLV